MELQRVLTCVREPIILEIVMLTKVEMDDGQIKDNYELEDLEYKY